MNKRCFLVFTIAGILFSSVLLAGEQNTFNQPNNKGNIFNQPNNQGNINNSVIGLPKPVAHAQVIKKNEPDKDLFKTEIELLVDTIVPIPHLSFEIVSPLITDAKIDPMRGGVFLIDVPNIKNGKAIIGIGDAKGKYKIIIVTKEPFNFPSDSFDIDIVP